MQDVTGLMHVPHKQWLEGVVVRNNGNGLVIRLAGHDFTGK
jgi:hypothetical protein